MEEGIKVLISQWGPAGVCLLFCGWLIVYLLRTFIPNEREQNRQDRQKEREDNRKDIADMRTDGMKTMNNLLTTFATNEQSNREEFRAALKAIQDHTERRHAELRQDVDLMRRAVWEQHGDPNDET